MTDISEHKKVKIKIGVLGDSGVGKSYLVSSFIASITDNTLVQTAYCKRIEKTIKNYRYIVDFLEFNTKNDKIVSLIQDCHVMFIVVDLNNRNSFDNLNDYWLSFLSDDCCWTKDVYILGNYFHISSSPLTSNEEVNEMLKISKINAAYIEIGNKTKDESNLLVDDLVYNTHLEEIKNAKTSGTNKGGSLRVDKCTIF